MRHWRVDMSTYPLKDPWVSLRNRFQVCQSLDIDVEAGVNQVGVIGQVGVDDFQCLDFPHCPGRHLHEKTVFCQLSFGKLQMAQTQREWWCYDGYGTLAVLFHGPLFSLCHKSGHENPSVSWCVCTVVAALLRTLTTITLPGKTSMLLRKYDVSPLLSFLLPLLPEKRSKKIKNKKYATHRLYYYVLYYFPPCLQTSWLRNNASEASTQVIS